MDLKKKKQQETRIDMVTIKNKIKKVLTETRSTHTKRHKELQKKRTSIRQKLLDQQEYLQYQGDYRICEVWEGDEKIETIQDDLYYDQTKQGIMECEHMLLQFDEESQQLRNDQKELSMYSFETLAEGLSKFGSHQQIKQIDNADIKKQVLQIGDLYEDGVLKIDKINQIYNTYYNLSVQECGICLNQPKIYQIIVLRCGHWLCFDCFKIFASSERIRNQLRKCPFCRQQIEYIPKE